MKRLFLSAVFALTLSAAENGMGEYISRYSVDETTKRLVDILRKKGATVFKVIDHGEGAASVGMELGPQKLVIFGNPRIGTPLMQCSPTLGLDLPQKILIYRDKKGTVHALFNTKAYLMWRHGVEPDCAPALQKRMDAAVKMFAKYATGNLKREKRE
ncbi:putative inner membrane or exported protein [Hydrogenimonas sp.]|nr:putative inner membrane or exported protein [Hydrogenimonas sp.]